MTALATINGVVITLIAIASMLVIVPLVIYLVRSRNAGQDIVAMVMLSLAVSDFGVGAIVPCSTAVFSFLADGATVSIPGTVVATQGSISHACATCSIWHLALMSAFKCYIIVRPLTHGAFLTDRRRNAAIAAVWAANIFYIVVANLAGVRWALHPLVHYAVPTVNPKASTGLRYFETCVMLAVGIITVESLRF